jgi:hypothetical protein
MFIISTIRTIIGGVTVLPGNHRYRHIDHTDERTALQLKILRELEFIEFSEKLEGDDDVRADDKRSPDTVENGDTDPGGGEIPDEGEDAGAGCSALPKRRDGQGDTTSEVCGGSRAEGPLLGESDR